MAESKPSDMGTSEEIKNLLFKGPPYLEGEKMVLTVSDIAEELGVTKQTVRNNIGDAITHPLLRTDTVGKANVYWRASEPDEGWFDSGREDDEIEEFAEQIVEDRRNDLIGARARWLQAEQDFLNGELDPSSPQDRWELWGVLAMYLDYLDRLGTVSFGTAARKQSLPDEYGDLPGLEQYDGDAEALPEGFRGGSFHDRLYETHLFDAPFGTEVRGIAMLYPHYIWTRRELGESPESDALDELLPSAKDIHYAGNVLDSFVAQLHAFYW